MRYRASEKIEIIRLIAQSHLPTKQTLDRLGIPRRNHDRWYDRYLNGDPEALEDRPSGYAWSGTVFQSISTPRSSKLPWSIPS